MQCYIVREKAPRGLLSKAPHVYKLYLEEGKVFLLAARRREHTKCPSYIITQDESSASRSSNTYCGKIRVRQPYYPVAFDTEFCMCDVIVAASGQGFLLRCSLRCFFPLSARRVRL